MRSKGGAANFKVGEGVNTVKTLKSKKKWGVYDHPPHPQLLWWLPLIILRRPA